MIDLWADTGRGEALRQLTLRKLVMDTEGFDPIHRVRDVIDATLAWPLPQGRDEITKGAYAPVFGSVVSILLRQMKVEDLTRGLLGVLMDDSSGEPNPDAALCNVHWEWEPTAMDKVERDRLRNWRCFQIKEEFPSYYERSYGGVLAWMDRQEREHEAGIVSRNVDNARKAVATLLLSRQREDGQRERSQLKPLTGASMDKVEYLIPGVLAAGQPCVIGGVQKSCKTQIAIDLAIALATGGKFLEKFPVSRACRVAMFSGESGAATLDGYIHRAVGKSPPSLRVYPVLPSVATVVDVLIEDPADVVILDPLYQLLDGENASNLFTMGKQFKAIEDACKDVGAMLVLVHHSRESVRPGDKPALEHLAFAGVKQFCRQWIMLNRRRAYVPGEADLLYCLAGGSAGHAELFALDHTADPWGWAVGTVEQGRKRDAEARALAKKAQEEGSVGGKAEAGPKRNAAREGKILDVLRAGPMTKAKISEATGITRQDRLNADLARLRIDGKVRERQDGKWELVP